MKKKIEILATIAFLIIAVFAGPKSARIVMNMKVREAPVCIVIDCGHGGADPGKVGVAGTKEKDINLEIGKKLKDYLEQQGMQIVMTREVDADLADTSASSQKVSDLRKRCEVIAGARPDFAISIHQNSYTDSQVSGAQVFYYGQSAKGEVLAKILQQSLRDNLEGDNKREAKANESYYMLKKTSVPTVIVECGFLSNPEEEQLLQDPKYQDQLVKAICLGIQQYLDESQNE